MNNYDKPLVSNKILFSILLCCLCSGILGAAIGYGLLPPYQIDAQPKSPDAQTQITFYIGYLNRHKITVINQTLATNTYKTFKDVYELTGFLQLTNTTTCYVDWDGYEGFDILSSKSYHVPKFWLQYDGIYWEVRF